MNKSQIVERCLKRVKEEYDNNPANLKIISKQDAIILNVQRACEACIALAMHIVAEEKLGLPQYSRDAFEILAEKSIINDEMATNLKSMVGFRNIAVHDYQNIDLSILQHIIESNLIDLKNFTKQILRYSFKT